MHAANIAPENMWKPGLWMQVLFLARKRDASTGTLSPLSFIPILLVIIVCLKFPPEEVIVAHNKHFQEQHNTNLSITVVIALATDDDGVAETRLINCTKEEKGADNSRECPDPMAITH